MKKIFSVCWNVVAHPGNTRGINNLVSENEKKRYFVKKFGITNLPTIYFLQLFPSFKETINPHSYLRGFSHPLDIALLKLLARRYKKCQFLEIGTSTGESLSNVASIADHCFSINLPEEELRKAGVPEEIIKQQRFHSNGLKNVTHIIGNSRTYDFTKHGKFDLIYIDGDHSYERVKIDTERAFKMLKNDESIIVWHDVQTNNADQDYEVLAGILDGCPPDKINRLYNISNTHCTIYFPKRFNVEPYKIPNNLQKSFVVKISSEIIKSTTSKT